MTSPKHLIISICHFAYCDAPLFEASVLFSGDYDSLLRLERLLLMMIS